VSSKSRFRQLVQMVGSRPVQRLPATHHPPADVRQELTTPEFLDSRHQDLRGFGSHEKSARWANRRTRLRLSFVVDQFTGRSVGFRIRHQDEKIASAILVRIPGTPEVGSSASATQFENLQLL
jgi:transposase InsO family protein